MSKKWMALVAMTALIGSIASVGCSSDDADNDSKNAGGSGGSGGSDTDGGDGGDGGSGGSDTDGGDGGSGGDGGGNQGCGSLEWSNNAECNSCMEDMCCAELAACDEGTECGDLLDCLEPCGADQACQQACVNQFPNGLADAQDLITCGEECDDECNAGAICDSGYAHQTRPACGTCLGDNCCDLFKDCIADAECGPCLTNPSADQEACAANEMLQDFNSCQDTNCENECTPGKICDSGLFIESKPECGKCLGSNCCDVVKACADDALCLACITGQKSGAECDEAEELLSAIDTCEGDNCSTECQ